MTRHLDRPGTGGKAAPPIPLPAAAGQYRTEDGAPQNACVVVAERRGGRPKVTEGPRSR